MRLPPALPPLAFPLMALLLGACATPRAASPPVAAPASGNSASVDEQAVAATVQRLFDAMERRDSTALRMLLHPQATLVAVDTAGRVQRIPDAMAWARSIAGSPVPLVERMHAPRVEVAGALATLWADYTFHVGERFSHCGTDAVQLVRSGGAWKIVVVTFTRQQTGCPAVPPARP